VGVVDRWRQSRNGNPHRHRRNRADIAMDLPLNESATVVLNGFGDGTARVGPHGHGLVWNPAVASVKVAPPVTSEATCKIYVGNQPTDDNFVDATENGSTGDSSGNVRAALRQNSFIWAVWHNGDPGAQATLTVTGSQTLEQ